MNLKKHEALIYSAIGIAALFFILLARWASPAVVDTIAAFSVASHFDAFQRGVIDSRDFIFFASVIGFALFVTGVVLRSHRAG